MSKNHSKVERKRKSLYINIDFCMSNDKKTYFLSKNYPNFILVTSSHSRYPSAKVSLLESTIFANFHS